MTCPLCQQPTTWEANPWRPFCSERCQITDLGTWAAEHYRIPGTPLITERVTPESDEHLGEGHTRI
ncbi:MAG: DNA gyrase inhibitor YacG [Nitrospira sp.]|nr:DNA gyrase inhibitor YacG [Nitrospira sp.]